jgi:hypothetical protein
MIFQILKFWNTEAGSVPPAVFTAKTGRKPVFETFTHKARQPTRIINYSGGKCRKAKP